MRDRIMEYVRSIAEKKGEVISEDTDLFGNGILDSMEIILLLNYLKEEFSISFSPEDLDFENYQTVNKIVSWAEGHSK